MSKRFAITLITLLVILAGAAIAILLSKGYTFSPKEKRIVGTGIISVTSLPDGASVYIDGHLTTATNATLPALPAKTYKIKMVKEGLVPWEKDVEVKEGLVSEVKATLFPAIPFAYPLTYNGVANPTLSPDGQKLAFLVPVVDDQHTRQKGGVWVWNMAAQSIAISRSAEPHQIVASTPALDFSKATLKWSPDSKQVLVTLQEGGKEGISSTRNYLLGADQFTSLGDLRDITPLVSTTLQGWEEEEKLKETTRVMAIKDLEVRQTASNSAVLEWSPDETKFIAGSNSIPSTDYRLPQKAEDGRRKTDSLLKGFKVYDLGSAKQSAGWRSNDANKITPSITPNTQTPTKSYDLPEALEYNWLPDSKHIIVIQNNEISIMEYDVTNKAVVFAGNFENGFVFPWPDSSRLAIVSSASTSPKPNLFGINLK